MDPQLFAEAASLLVHNHGGLRMRLTSAHDEDGVPLQTFVDPWPLRVPLRDVSSEAYLDTAALDLRPDHHRRAVGPIDWERREFLAEIFRRTLYATSITFDRAVLECFLPLSVGGDGVIVRNVIVSAPALTAST